MHRLPVNNTGSDNLDPAEFRGLDITQPVDRIPHRIDNTAEHDVAHRNLSDLSGPLYNVPFLDMFDVAQNGYSHVIFLEVKDHAHYAS